MTLILNRRTLIRLQQYNDGEILTKRPEIFHFVKYGHLSLICLFNKKDSNIVTQYNVNAKCNANVLAYASMYGQLRIVKWFYKNRTWLKQTKYDTRVMNAAAANGHLDVIEWLHNNCTDGCTKSAMDGAAENGHLDVIEWLYENRTEGCSTNALHGAAENGHLDVVEWLCENISDFDIKTIKNSVKCATHYTKYTKKANNDAIKYLKQLYE